MSLTSQPVKKISLDFLFSRDQMETPHEPNSDVPFIAVEGHKKCLFRRKWASEPCLGPNPQFAGNHDFSALSGHNESGTQPNLCVKGHMQNPG